jgi:hypothetical protein
VLLCFETLAEIGIDEIMPQLIANFDETMFGASKSGLTKSRKVIFPDGIWRNTYFQGQRRFALRNPLLCDFGKGCGASGADHKT